VSPSSAERAAAFYEEYLGAPIINVGSLEAAEMVKLAGMAYRDVNIALANELARYAEAVGVDLNLLIDAINTNREAHVLLPGIGVGGHCTPVYPYFLIRDADRRGAPVRLPEMARQVNDGQAVHAIELLESACGPLAGLRVLILGLAFRPQLKEHIYSTAFLLRSELESRGAVVSLHDPLYSEEEICGHGFVTGNWTSGPAPDVLVLNTAHDVYADLDFATLKKRGLKAVVDGRAVWRPEDVREAGVEYVGIGRPLAQP
jgi:nucleotide sugar dehydrogenase